MEHAEALGTGIDRCRSRGIDRDDVGSKIGDPIIRCGPVCATVCRLVNSTAKSRRVNRVRVQRINCESSDAKKHVERIVWQSGRNFRPGCSAVGGLEDATLAAPGIESSRGRGCHGERINKLVRHPSRYSAHLSEGRATIGAFPNALAGRSSIHCPLMFRIQYWRRIERQRDDTARDGRHPGRHPSRCTVCTLEELGSTANGRIAYVDSGVENPRRNCL